MNLHTHVVTLERYLVSMDRYDFLILAVHVVLALIVLQALRMIFRLSKNKLLGLTTKPFSTAGTNGRRILLLGDSTAVGTGAARAEDTIAGRLAHDFPGTEIINLAQNGGLVRDIPGQIAPLSDDPFDLIIVSAGGNDVWHLTRLSRIAVVLKDVLPRLVALSRGRVLFLLYNNIGAAPVFPFFMRGFLTRRCEAVQDTIRAMADAADVPTINLFVEDRNNPFTRDPEGLFATDGIHPSSEGYRLWYHRMWRTMTERGYRF